MIQPSKIQSLNDKIAQLENQKKLLIKRENEKERKARTKRLIERGAILEGFIPTPTEYTNDQIQAFLKRTIDSDFARKALRQIKPSPDTQNAATSPQNAPQQGASAAPHDGGGVTRSGG